MHDAVSLLLLFAQIGVILVVARAMGMLFARLRQPQVVGEMIAGIMLGPSLLGWLWPEAYALIFPSGTIRYLYVLSQLGVIFFLFLVGLELDLKMLRSFGASTLFVAGSSIVVPFVLGAGLTFYLYHRGLFWDPSGEMFIPALLFMGAAMAITAFPVLARILTERNLQKSPAGAISIACAAVNDAAAWVILAFVVASVHAESAAEAVWTGVFSLLYIAVMFLLVRPLVQRLGLLFERQGRLTQQVVALIFLLVLISAAATEAIGIHAMFGAFVMGTIMPKGTRFVHALTEKLEDYTVVLLLPIFFAYTGLKTNLGLLGARGLWFDTGLIVAVACIGKFIGSAAPARLTGVGWRESSAIGVLMNTRGLVELVILSIGRDLRVINDSLFAMMVIMALATTFLTTPLIDLIYPARIFGALRRKIGAARSAGGPAVLIPVSLPQTGPSLLRAAQMLAPAKASPRILAMHLRSPTTEDHLTGLTDPAAEQPSPLEPLLGAAADSDADVEPISFVSRDVASDITWAALSRRVDLILMGYHKPLIGQTLLGGVVNRVLTYTRNDAAVLIDRGLEQVRTILVPFLGGTHDRFALELAGRMAANVRARVIVLHVTPASETAPRPSLNVQGAVDRIFTDPSQPKPVTVKVVRDDSPVDAVLRESVGIDLVVIGSSEQWGLESHRFGWKPERIAHECPTSLLIVQKAAASPSTATLSDSSAVRADPAVPTAPAS